MISEELQVLITAQNAQLLTAIDETNRKIGTMGATATSEGARVSTSFTKIAADAARLGAAATAAAGAALYLFKQIADGVDTTNQLALSLGISYTEMTRLQYAAQQAGVENGALTQAMRLLNRNFGEIATGGGAAARTAIERLGLSVEQLQGMNAAERFEAISTALRGVEDAATRAALAQELFGKGGQQVLPLVLSDVAALTKEFDSLGVSLTQLDVAALDNAGDAMDRLQSAAMVTAQKFSAQLAPAIQAGAEALQELVFGGGEMSKSTSTAADVLTFAMGKALDIILALKGALDVATGAIMNLGAFGVDVFESLLWGVDMLWRPMKTMINGWIEIHNLVFKDEQWALLGDLHGAVEETEKFSANLHDAGTILAGKGFSEIGKAFSGEASSQFFNRVNKIKTTNEVTGDTPTGAAPDVVDVVSDEDQKKLDVAKKAHDEQMKQAEEWAAEKRVAAADEEEQLLAKYKQDMLTLNEHNANKLLSEQEYTDTALALQEKLNKDVSTLSARRAKQERDESDARLANQKREFIGSIAAAAQHNRAFFELHKAMKLAEAALNIPAAVSGAYTVGATLGGPMLGAAFGATAFAAQVVNMQAIASSSFGGGSAASSAGASAPPATSTGPTASDVAAAPVTSAAPSRYTTINLQGEVFSREQVRGLINQISEEMGDGANNVLRAI